MITRITLKNFMSHEKTVIEPAPGLTVLIGPNNVGKSAVISALQILCHNENSTYVMRHDAKQCSVTVETSDGHTVTWRRKKSPSYTINGEKFDRLRGSDHLEELHQALRLPKVQASNDVEFDVHFGAQKSPIFLLDSSSANAARFFASSSDAIRLVEMQKRHKDKHADVKRRKLQLEQEAEQVDKELEILEPAVALAARVDALEITWEEINGLAERLDDFERQYAELLRLERSRNHWQRSAAVLVSLAAPPALHDPVPLEELVARITGQTQRRELCDQTRRCLSALADPPELGDTQTLERLAAQMTLWGTRHRHCDSELNSLKTLAGPPHLADTTGLEQLTAQLASATHRWRLSEAQATCLTGLEELSLAETGALDADVRAIEHSTDAVAFARERHALLATLAEIPVPRETSDLAELLTRMAETQTRVEAAQGQLQQAEQERMKTAAELKELTQDKQCPICGGPLDPEQVLACAAEGGHRHE